MAAVLRMDCRQAAAAHGPMPEILTTENHVASTAGASLSLLKPLSIDLLHPSPQSEEQLRAKTCRVQPVRV